MRVEVRLVTTGATCCHHSRLDVLERRGKGGMGGRANWVVGAKPGWVTPCSENARRSKDLREQQAKYKWWYDLVRRRGRERTRKVESGKRKRMSDEGGKKRNETRPA